MNPGGRAGFASVALAIVLSSGTVQAQSGLKIVVISGEDAVNVIQQKTAVAPVIEVRDRNDLPVPGAVVTFSIQGGKAAMFAGGSPTMTITTNAAGRATAAALNPLGSGAVQINVQAVFQGQTVAATIAQTNVLTAAEAAQAAAAGASSGGSGGAGAGGAGGAAGGGGGLSGATIGAIGGAVAAGAVVATKAGGNGTDSPGGGAQAPIATPPSPPCTEMQFRGGGDATETRTIQLGRTSGTFVFSFDSGHFADRFLVAYEDRTLLDTGCAKTNPGTFHDDTLTYSGTSTSISVTVFGNCARNPENPYWIFKVSCPR